MIEHVSLVLLSVVGLIINRLNLIGERAMVDRFSTIMAHDKFGEYVQLSDYQTLEQEHNDLKISHESLYGHYTDIENDYSDLSEEYETLKIVYLGLKEEYDDLKYRMDGLEK